MTYGVVCRPMAAVTVLSIMLTACGGGGGGTGGGIESVNTGSSRSSYDGIREAAPLTLENRDEFLQALFGNIGGGLIVSFLEFDRVFEEGIETMTAYNVDTINESQACDNAGSSISAAAKATNNYFDFTIEIDYDNCLLYNSLADGSFYGEVALSSRFGEIEEADRIYIDYKKFSVSDGGDDLELDGTEERRALDIGTSTIKNILISESIGSSNEQHYYENLSYTMDYDGYSYSYGYWSLSAYVALSGTYYYSELGSVTVSLQDSFNNPTGKAIVVSGASGSTITLDYVNGSLSDIEISLDVDGDGTPDDVESMPESLFRYWLFSS